MSNISENGGVGVCGLLTITFIVLKLMGVINWSWLWVLAPLWIPVSIGAMIIFAIVVVAFITNPGF